ncbi:cell division protein DivIB [Paraliobacillus quinghaiensis]|uniref:Cell division protein DivIB n=1 Tax=Paraliobacillus quinghaiensis TaxID=470815 RepID=A0A917TFC1_9BACI|nr:FtsQ-type POTRA domain-containing protein [Paraliobacillus quinghaiensis]GGM20615.1 cell division protein DivIB [Paraliobacillus quinghaiensis]
MEEKKVVSIEDRIPKLKQERKKKTNRRLIFYVSLFFILISIVAYLQSPLSRVQHITVTGNEYVTNEAIIAFSELSEEDNFWGIKMSQRAAKVGEHPEIKEVQVTRELPNTIVIKVEELDKVAYVKKEDGYYPLLENGEILESVDVSSLSSDAPILNNFTNNTYIIEIAKELYALPHAVSSLISEISWQPSDANPYKVWLFMNDGYEVESTIRNFATYLKSYPSIVSQLAKDQTGVIRIGDGGAIFDPYEKANKEEDNETAG